MGMFSKVNDAEVTQGGVYFKPGKYRVKITAVKTVQSAKNSRDYFCVECSVVESNVPGLEAGARASQVIDISNIMGPPNIKAFVAAASGVNPTAEDVDAQTAKVWADIADWGAPWNFEKICEYAVGEDQPFADVELDLECRQITTRAGNPFTKHFWNVAA